MSESEPLLTFETTSTQQSGTDYIPENEEIGESSSESHFLGLDPKRFHSRVNYYIPVLGWLPKYDYRNALKNDLIAGVSVACILIPQSLSFAQALVNLPPVYGLYTSFIPVLIYSLLGTSRQLSIGPEALVSILTGSTIAEYMNAKHNEPVKMLKEDPTQGNILETIALANFMALLVGLFTFVLGFFRLGFLDSVLSRPLLRGFINAVAVVVMIELGEKMLGLSLLASERVDKSPFQILIHVLHHLGDVHLPTFFLSTASMVFIFVSRKLKTFLPVGWSSLKLIPEILVLVVVTTGLSGIFKWNELGIDVLEQVEGGLRAPQFPQFTVARLNNFFLTAILISVIGFVESIAITKMYASKHNYSVSPNRELVAIGVSNAVGSLFGAWPVFGSLGRSSVNDHAGAQSQMAGFITCLCILLSAYFLMPFLFFLPKAVCASIIVSAAIRLIELDEVFFVFRLKAWQDMSLLLLTFFTTLFVSIEAGTILSIGVSLFMVVRHSTKPKMSILGRAIVMDKKTLQPKEKFKSISEFKDAETIPGFLIIRFDEALYFGNVSYLKDRLNRAEKFGSLHVHPGDSPLLSHHPMDELKRVVFNFMACQSVDISAVQCLMDIVKDYKARNITVYFVKVHAECLEWMDRAGLIDLIEGRVFEKVSDCLED